MTSMQFWSKIVKHPTDLRLRVSQGGIILMIASFGLISVFKKIGWSEDFAAVGMVFGLCIALVGWILRRFKHSGPVVSDIDLVVTSEEIRIGEQRFRVAEVEYLDFLVNSYYGMLGPRMRFRRLVLKGVDNKLLFKADGKQHSYPFFLEDEMAMRRLGMLFREFYSKGVRFRERNRGGRTFLFEQVLDRQEFERAKQAEGYL